MKDIDADDVSWERLKILDFYVLFPHLISKMSLPQELVHHRTALRAIPAPYENLPSASRLLFELSEIQEQTIKSLIAKGLVEKEPFLDGRIKIRFQILPREVKQLIEDTKFRAEEWYEFLTNVLVNIPTKGTHGLKARTGLMEYRYDVV